MIAQERLQALADAAGEGADEEAASGGGEGEVLRQIQAILYSTEDGFEVPEGNEVSILAFETLSMKATLASEPLSLFLFD